MITRLGLLLAGEMFGIATDVDGQTRPTLSISWVGSTAQLIWDAPLGSGSFVVEQSDSLGVAATWQTSSLGYLSLTGGGTTVRHVARVGDVNSTTFFRVRQLPHFAYAANTIEIRNVEFTAPKVVQLSSALGLLAPNPNTGAAPVPGYVNFLSGVLYNAVPAQFQIGVTISVDQAP